MPTSSHLTTLNGISLKKANEKPVKLEVSPILERNPVIQLGGGKCTVRAANTYELKEQAYKLLYKNYSKMGVAEIKPDGLWLSIFNALPETTTFVAEDSEGKIEGTLTLVFDSPIGLPADELYSEELYDLRGTGAKICEFISLGINSSVRSSIRALGGLFFCAYIYAWLKKKSSHLVITINPHHEDFYCQKTFFKKIGPERSYAKVNGKPALLLGVPLKIYKTLKNQHRIFPFYLFNYSDQEELDIADSIGNMVLPMSDEEFYTFFIEKTDIWEKASPQQKDYIKSAYPVDKINHYAISRKLAQAFSKNTTKSDENRSNPTKIVHRNRP